MSSGPGLVFLNLDGSLPLQSRLLDLPASRLIDLLHWGPRLRMGCTHAAFNRFCDDINAQLPPGPAITCYGSGDFHHISLALLRRIAEPFNLVIFDKHPDWMRRIPILHCGTWVAHAALLPNLRNILHLGGDLDFDNAWRLLAPWPLLRRKRMIVLPARRSFNRGQWRGIQTYPLNQWRPEYDDLFSEKLAEYPVYISIDKDVLRREDAIGNWDSGYLTLSQLSTWISRILQWAQYRCVGADILGDYSPVNMQGLLRRFLHLTGHPPIQVDDLPRAASINHCANTRLISLLRQPSA